MVEVGDVQQQFNFLVGRLGIDRVAINFEIDEALILEYWEGKLPIEAPLSDDVREMYERMSRLAPVGDEEDDLVGEIVLGVDLDGDGKVDIDLSDIGLVSHDVTWNQNMELRRQSLHANHALAMMTQFRLGIPYQQRIGAVGMVTQIELALILCYKESIPDADEPWDAVRRAREVETRLHTLRWVEREQEKEYGGVRGVLNWMIGRTKQSGKEIQKNMMKDAGGVLDALSEEGPNMDAVKRIMEFTGGDYLLKE